MTTTAERDDVQEQLCARIDELERDKEELNRQLDHREAERTRLLMKADALQRIFQRIAPALDLDPDTDLTREAPARVEALAAHVERLHNHVKNSEELHPATWAVRGIRLMQEAPTTSLARLIAQKQAEVLDEAVDLHICDSQDQCAVLNMAAELRRQAEGGGHED